MTVRGTGQGQTDYGIYAPRIKRTVFENVHVEQVGAGFFSYQLFQTRSSSVRFEYAHDGFVVQDDGSGLGASTSIVLENCYVNHASEFGYDLFGLS